MSVSRVLVAIRPGRKRRDAARHGDLLLLTGGLLVAQAMSALTAVVAARSITTGDFGRQASVLGVATLAVLLVDGGTSTDIQRRIAAAPHTDSLVLFVTRRWAIAGLLLIAAGALTPVSPLAAAGMAYVATLSLTNALSGSARGLSRFRLVSAASVFDKAAALATVIVLLEVLPHEALVLALGAGSAVQTAIYALVAAPMRPRGKTTSELGTWVADYRQARHFLGISLTTELQRLDVPIVNIAAGSTAAGLFAAPARLTQALGVPANAVSQMALTKFSGHGRVTPEAVVRLLFFISGAYLLIAVVLVPLAPTLTSKVLGEHYRKSALILIIYGFAMVPAAANQLLATSLAAIGQESVTARAVTITVPVSLTVVAIGAALSGATAAAFGFLVSQSLLTVMLLRQVQRNVRAIG